ncbi:MAG TPA: TonB-dependent receptor [Chitinophagaceae bacterium]|nr:TonB-dependent receptor [Chitinophagaceae bacterium]
MKQVIFSIAMALTSLVCCSQQEETMKGKINAAAKHNISGTIRNKITGESIIGATIKVLNNREAIISNEYGFFSLTLPEGNYILEISYAGLPKLIKEIHLFTNLTSDIYLDEYSKTLDEVVINNSIPGRSVSGTQMGTERLSIQEMKYIPQLFGEKDPMKAIQLLPGIKAVSEGNSGIYVRGGAADQNLILLDEAPVYNASHLLGFFSTFNPDAIKDITVYKTGMPAQYGGRLSSVVDIRMNDGNSQDYTISGGLGLISSKLNIEGPVQKDKSSFLVSGRSTYVDLFLKLSNDSIINRNKIGFYDLNAKMNFTMGKKDKLFISGYFGNDHLNAGDNFGLYWGNTTGTLRWNHIYSNKIFANSSLIYSNFNYGINLKLGANDVNIFSQIRDWNLKEELQWNPNAQHTFRIGINSIYHAIQPGNVTSSLTSSFNNVVFQKRFSSENALYFSDAWKLNNKWNLTYGTRLSGFSILGKGDFYNLDDRGKITDTIRIDEGKILKTYLNIEPRLAVSYLLTNSSSLKASYVRNTQNLHLISNSTSARPTDRWVASTNNIKPETSSQVSLGYYKNLLGIKYELTVETYFKGMQNQIDYRDGSDITDANALETQLLYGKGRAYGLEFLFRKKSGRFTGWLSYTLSKSEKKIDGINNNEWYNARQDRTHEIAIVGTYKLKKKWTLSANWVLYTGDAVSFPEGKYNIGTETFFYYTKRNGYRMPTYHRLDLAATKVLKQKKRFTSELSFSLYNAYGRENAYSITFRDKKAEPLKTEAVKTTLFRFIPSISYNFKF